MSVIIAFIAGYYMGKISWARVYITHSSEQAFSDKLYASLFAVYERDPLLEQEESKACDVDAESSSESLSEPDVPAELYYAELIGFKSLRSANRYVDKLVQQGLPVRVVKRVSARPGKKKERTVWYQVVTDDIDRQTLEEIVEGLQKHDKLTGVKIKRRESRSKERLTS